jgi:hypothetical protein
MLAKRPLRSATTETSVLGRLDGKAIAAYIFLGAIAGSFISVFAIFMIGDPLFDISFLSEKACGQPNTPKFCFVDENWDSENYLSIITEFYSTIITILIGILGVVAAFAFVVIRNSAHQWAEEVAEKAVATYLETGKAEPKMLEWFMSSQGIHWQKLENRLATIEIALDEAEILINGVLGNDDAKKTE